MNTITILTILLFAIGAFQGIVYGFILWNSKKQNKTSNRLLSTILFLFSYRLIVQILRLFGLGYYDIWYYFMLDLSWVNGALLYFYVQAQVIPDFKISRTDRVHFVPVVIQVVISIFVRLQNLYWDGTRESLSWLGYWGYMAWMNYATIYIIASLLIVIYALKSWKILAQPQEKIEIAPQRTNWLKRIIISFLIYFAIVLATLIIDFIIQYLQDFDPWYFYFKRFFYYPFFGGLSILTYWIGLEGFKRKDQTGITLKNIIPTEKREQLEQIASQLNDLMVKEKIYKDPDLSLRIVANQLSIKPYLLSKCLNEVLSTKFNDYVNTFRVEEVKRLLQDPNNQKFTLLSLAFDAGFNSKSSFNRAVKKHLGISPSELRDSVVD